MHVFHTLYTLISQWLLIALTTVPNISKNSIEGCFLVLVRERGDQWQWQAILQSE